MSLRPPDLAFETIGPYLESARLLGRRTAELHLALSSDPEDPAFSPEPFTPFKRRSTYQSMRTLTRQVFRVLRGRLSRVPAAAEIADREEEILERFERLLHERVTATLIRTHGDYHLGQVLWTGKDFVIIDFEGEPARTVSERRIKRSPLRDVAGMLRSFHYAAQVGRRDRDPNGEQTELGEMADQWEARNREAFLDGYLPVAEKEQLLPAGADGWEPVLAAFELDKAVYETVYEARNRPGWLPIPLNAIARITESQETKTA